MASDEAQQLVGRFVWEKWRNVWYMGRIVEASSPNHEPKAVCVHIHGERDTNDKWFPLTSANLELLAVIPSEVTAIGAFPAPHEHVELLLMDQKLYDLLVSHCPEQGQELLGLTLVGKIVQVLPAHDASVVDVAYPPAYHNAVCERRVHIGNGYVSLLRINHQHFYRVFRYRLICVAFLLCSCS